MRTRFNTAALGVCAALLMTASASAQRRSGAENALVGIRLFDSGAKVVSIYGSPDQIQPVSVGGGAGARGGGNPFGGGGFPGGAGRGGGSPFGGAPGRPGMGSPGLPPALDNKNSFSFGDEVLNQMGGPGMPGVPPGMGGPGPGMQGGPPPGFPGGPGAGFPGGPGAGAPRGGGGMAGGGTPQETTYTRWVYNRSGSKYGFIIDKAGRVIQIEAIGITNPRVRTKRGVGFGSHFATIIKKYGNPDGYEIAGDNIMMRYLTRYKVAFRLSRLGEKKPHQVTGVVVAAGKG